MSIGPQLTRLTRSDLIDTYLNGPRTLSNERISYLVVSTLGDSPGALPTPLNTPDLARTLNATFDTESLSQYGLQEYDILICAAHFLGDGMALHRFANDFFGILGSDRSAGELEDLVTQEWRSKWFQEVDPVSLSDCANHGRS